MNLKRFLDIPMADAEMVFPDKRVFLRPLLVIQLSVAIIGGLIAGLTALLSVRTPLDNIFAPCSYLKEGFLFDICSRYAASPGFSNAV